MWAPSSPPKKLNLEDPSHNNIVFDTLSMIKVVKVVWIRLEINMKGNVCGRGIE